MNLFAEGEGPTHWKKQNMSRKYVGTGVVVCNVSSLISRRGWVLGVASLLSVYRRNM